MSCCTAGGTCDVAMVGSGSAHEHEEVLLASRAIGNGLHETSFAVPTIHCGGCMQKIEQALAALPRVEYARVNLSTKQVIIRWEGEAPPSVIETLSQIGYEAHLYDASLDEKDPMLGRLLRAVAVAGFAAGNIMLLSVSIWSGATSETRELFHWISAFIALPALIYSGSIFFNSAWRALRVGRTNMDVPISIGVLLALGMSLYETIVHGPHAYFDAATALVFFLLVGRTLDYVMRARARTAITGLARLAPRGALVLHSDGTENFVPVNGIKPGMTLLLAAGDRIPVDARVIAGRSDIDCSLISGESVPQVVTAGSYLQAGTLNLTGPLTVVAAAAAENSFLADMIRMMQAAEVGHSAYRRIADRAARLYAPVVHATALLTFVGWMIASGDAHQAITIAIAVLIITCPCALGLAVPMVHVVAARRLFENGIMLKDGGGLERLAEIDSVVFDKTGTLTLGEVQFINVDAIEPASLALAVAIAAHSRHPYSLAIAAAGRRRGAPPVTLNDVTEILGSGLESHVNEKTYRLGQADWALANELTAHRENASVVLSQDGRCLAAFRFRDRMRADAPEAVSSLKHMGCAVEVLSGDHEDRVRELASALGLAHTAGVSPREKTVRIAAMAASGHKVLMVGDGLNDAPALVAAHASMAPATAADVGRNAADFVFMRDSLMAVPEAIIIARRARRLVHENLTLAVIYNLVAVPIAALGLVTPLLAAVAMSLSSLLVVANAQRLLARGRQEQSSVMPSFSQVL
jgi:P-type Cu2+ transporter